MRLPVDTSVVHFVSAGPAEPSLDFDTKQQKLDANGVAVNQVHLFVVGDGGTREVITVKVSGEVARPGPVHPDQGDRPGGLHLDHGRPLWGLLLGLEDRGGAHQGLGLLMGQFVAFVLLVLVALMLVGFVLAHFGIVVILVLGVVVLGRHLRRHGV